jgi:hypothetical protein
MLEGKMHISWRMMALFGEKKEIFSMLCAELSVCIKNESIEFSNMHTVSALLMINFVVLYKYAMKQ